MVVIQQHSYVNKILWRYFKIAEALIQDHSKNLKEVATPQTKEQQK